MKEVMDFECSFLMDKMQRREYEQREKAFERLLFLYGRKL